MFNTVPEKNIRYLIVLGLVLLSLVLRIHHIDFESLFMDELYQVSFYSQGFTDIIRLAASQQQPPLDYWIGHFFSKVWDSDFGVRLPAALFGVGTVLLLYQILYRFTHPIIAGFVSGLVAVLPFHLYFSQHARPYAIAIFFVTALLSVLQLIMNAKKVSWKAALLLFFVSFCFLMSRTLSPFVSVLGILGVLTGLSLYSYSKWGGEYQEYRKCLLQTILIILAALACYFPFLKLILDNGGRYANVDAGLINTISAGVKNFSVFPVWEAFITQFEPVGYWLVIALIAAYLFWLIYDKKSNNLFLKIIFILLPLISLLNVFIFQAKTTYNFRPPYAIYLIPFCVILLAYIIQKLLDLMNERNIRQAGAFTVVLLMTFWVPATIAMVNSKSLRKVTDWRGVSHFLQGQHKNDQIYVFGSLTPGRWEPTFFGFPRYYQGKFNGTNFASIPQQLPLLMKASFRPIVILFYHHDYVLTNNSPYSFHSARGAAFNLSAEKLINNDNLFVETFTGFYVVSTKRQSDNSVDELRFLLEQIVESFPENSAFAEIHVTLAVLKKALNLNDWQKHIDVALRVANPTYFQKASNIASALGENNSKR